MKFNLLKNRIKKRKKVGTTFSRNKNLPTCSFYLEGSFHKIEFLKLRNKLNKNSVDSKKLILKLVILEKSGLDDLDFIFGVVNLRYFK